MTIESATSISTLDANNPAGGDQQLEGDNHIRLIKAVLQTVFPNADVPFRFPKSAAAKVADYNVSATTDQNAVIPVSASGAARTVNLPAMAAANDGFMVTVFKSDSSANAVTLDGSGGDTINGATTQTLTYQFDAMILIWCNAFGQWLGFRIGVPLVPTFTTIELGGPGVTDTTLSRSAAGVAAVEGVDLLRKTSDVVDDLVTASAALPLSANQGVVLKGLVDGLDTDLTAVEGDVATLDAEKIEIDTNSAAGTTVFEIGTTLFAIQGDVGASVNRCDTVNVYLYAGQSERYITADSISQGTQLAGVWRCRGAQFGAGVIVQRVS